ncbi:MAG: ribosome small subunit-dependent GTPase A [Christensenellales bacterium]|nr:ribosome small subunit-dependent GTPase A [Christensenellales bacterium]
MQSAEGVIIKGVGGLYYARGEDGGTHVLRARGIFRRRHITPMVGDRVRFTPGQGEEHGWVEEILPRESQLVRPPVANVRYLVIVLAPAPAPDYLLIDTLIAMALRQGIRPALVVNKCDLDGGTYEAVRSDYAGLGAPLLAVSALSGQGMDGLRSLLASGVCCLAGQSGVGKSTLLCAATGLRLQTGEISQKIHRGRHTTRHAELLFSGEYRVLDTPGFSLLELWEGLEPIRLKEYYPEFAPYEGQCRFSPCYHLSEPGCAVLKAARAGEISQARLERYHLLLKKAQEAWRNRYD